MRHIHDPLQAIESSIGGANLIFWNALREKALSESLPVYLVGGPIRDVLLGAPIKDLDFVLEGNAPDLARSMAAALDWELVVHDRFGTATVSHEGCNIDVVTARRESYPTPGALPDVLPGAVDDDLARRDFSINTLALSVSEAAPEILDRHGGVDDIKQGLVRTLHPNSFADDPTRLLRAVRYEQRFGFAFEPETRKQLADALSKNYLDAVSGDRLRHELERILEEESPAPALVRSIELGILPAIHPGLAGPSAIKRLESAPTDDAEQDLLIFLAALAYNLSPLDAEQVVQRFNMPGDWAKVVRDVVTLRGLESRLLADNLRPSQVVGLLDGVADAAVDALAQITENGPVTERIAQFQKELRWVAPSLDGNALLAMGVPQGPLVGEILAKLRESRLDGLVESDADERRLVETIIAGGVDA